MPVDEKIYVNGIDGTTGQYLVEPLEVSEVARFALGEKAKRTFKNWLQRIIDNWKPKLGLPAMADPNNLEDTGWGIVFHKQEDPAVIRAFDPLIQARAGQVKNDKRLKTLFYDGEEYEDWLGRNQGTPGTIDADAIPYYLLVVGSPECISFDFTARLDAEYGVGRLHYDKVEDYIQYVASLLEYENAETLPSQKEAVFFATRHDFDKATTLSADHLAAPLAGTLGKASVAEQAGYRSRSFLDQDALKSKLHEILCPSQDVKPPSFLFTASHGIGWPNGTPGQKENQGALLCQNWPGFGSVNPSHYFAAADLDQGARLHGMISFHFACFSAGTPKEDRFLHKPSQPPPQLSPEPFLAALPKAMLSHPQGGCLATIGHIERAWGYSISPLQNKPNIKIFESAITAILQGVRVGYAMKDFNERCTFFSNSLIKKIEKKRDLNMKIDDIALAEDWIQRNDAEGYIVLGDPAARLRVEKLS